MADTARLQRTLRTATIGSGLTDTELLGRYASRRDEAAFAEIVRRNGPVVLRACRSILGDGASIDDAFQATFLLLARRAGRLTRPGSLAGWLHTAAVRTARTARRADVRRHRAERVVPPAAAKPDDLTWREVRDLLDVELAKLPERYRVPLVLCYLQELPHEEAARRAGCPVGALRGRLERGKARLRKRLARYGLPVATPILVLGRPEPVPAAHVDSALAVSRAWRMGGAIPGAVSRLLPRTTGARLWLFTSTVALAAVALAVAGALPGTADPKRAPEGPPLAAVPGPPPRTDALGDALPPGAVMRLGTRRFQASNWPVRPVPLPGGGHYLVFRAGHYALAAAEFQWMDATTGVVTARWPLPAANQAAGVSNDGRWAVIAKPKYFTTGARVKPDPKTGPIEFTLCDLPARKAAQNFECQSDELEGSMAYVHGAIVSDDGKWIATVNSGDGRTGRVRLWSAVTGTLVWASAYPDASGPRYTLLGFTPGAAELVLRGAKGNRIHVIDTTTTNEVRSFATTSEQIDGEVLAPDGSAVILATYSPKARVWGLKSGKERAPFEGHTEWVRRSAFTPDGKTLVTCGNDSYLLVRDWPSGKVRARIDLGRGAVQDLSVTGDGRTVDVRFWSESALAGYDLRTGKPVERPDRTHRAAVLAVTTAPDGAILSVGVDKVLRAWDPDTGRQVRSSALDPGDGNQARTLHRDGTISDPSVISPDGRLRARPGPDADTMSVWDVKSQKAVATFKVRQPGWWTSNVVPAFSPDGRTLAIPDGEAVRLLTVDGWRPIGEIPTATSALAFSPDGRSLATADLNDVILWEVATRRPRAVIRAAQQWPVRPRFSPDGRFLAWLVRTDLIEIWDVRRGQLVGQFGGHEGPLRDFTFTADGRNLVTASDDCTLLVWDVAGAASRKPGPEAMSEKAFRSALDDLEAADPDRAWAAVRVLAADPERIVSALRASVRPAAPVDGAKLDALLAGLDSDDYATRERSTARLIAIGLPVETNVRALLNRKPSPEVQRRAEQVLEAIIGPATTTDQLRELRAVEVLEWAGTTAARDLLRDLAKGMPEARLTRDASAALARLGPEAASR
jgi:RNA polymerase sigma factor (sigma-70 family)